MPIYEYKCSSCGEVMSVLAMRSDCEPPACRKCGSKDVTKLLSSFCCSGQGPAGGGSSSGFGFGGGSGSA